HVPSRSVPPIKGSSIIVPALRKLEGRGLIEAVLPASVSHSEMKSLVESVDIVVDQVLTGSYGVAAVEAMALGKVVVGNVSQFVQEVIGSNVPIFSVDPRRFEHELTRLVIDWDLRRHL